MTRKHTEQEAETSHGSWSNDTPHLIHSLHVELTITTQIIRNMARNAFEKLRELRKTDKALLRIVLSCFRKVDDPSVRAHCLKPEITISEDFRIDREKTHAVWFLISNMIDSYFRLSSVFIPNGSKYSLGIYC